MGEKTELARTKSQTAQFLPMNIQERRASWPEARDAGNERIKDLEHNNVILAQSIVRQTERLELAKAHCNNYAKEIDVILEQGAMTEAQAVKLAKTEAKTELEAAAWAFESLEKSGYCYDARLGMMTKLCKDRTELIFGSERGYSRTKQLLLDASIAIVGYEQEVATLEKQVEGLRRKERQARMTSDAAQVCRGRDRDSCHSGCNCQQVKVCMEREVCTTDASPVQSAMESQSRDSEPSVDIAEPVPDLLEVQESVTPCETPPETPLVTPRKPFAPAMIIDGSWEGCNGIESQEGKEY